MEIKIPKEVCQYRETIFFDLYARQFLCAALYVAETIFNMLVLVGLVKGAERIAKEMFGL